MIVKDESHIIEETLNSVLKYISYWVISDTGSTDNTKEIIKSFFEKHSIPGYLVEHKWKDFGSNRTYALQSAYKRRKHFDYIWVFDADDLVVGDLIFPKDRTKDIYLLKYGSDFTYMRQQLFNSFEKWRYVGVLHEYPKCVSKKNPSKDNIKGEYYINSRRLGARNKNEDKYLKDVKVLLQGLKDEPNNVRYMFYLAQSYLDCKDFQNSIKWYTKRVEKGGWFEEVYYSLYRIATNMECLGEPWEKVENAFMKAWKYLPSRAEPLYEIAKHYRLENDFSRAYTLAKTASKIPFPADQLLFIFKDVYDIKILDELSICAYYIKKYQESFDISNSLLKKELSNYDRERIEKNRDNNIEHIMNSYISYPVKKILEIRNRKNAHNEIIFTMTTCKRYDLFHKTINSFLNCCEDYLKIDKWLCVDDNSSEEDRKKMKKLYPFFEFICKTPEQKGHIESMNIIYSHISNYKYNIHMEDDWQFFEKRKYITEATEILENNNKLGQLLFNRNYAERSDCRNIVGGIVNYSPSGIRYLIHEHYDEGTKEYQDFQNRNNEKFNCMYWPHYSLRPSVLKVSVMKEVGDFQNETGHFEMDYSNRYNNLGYKSAFLDTISCYHIGKCTWEKGDNAYKLNDVNQFSNDKHEEIIDEDWIIIPDMDSFGNDITYLKNAEIEVLKLAALSDSNCVGFNTLGYLKSFIEPSDKWISVSYPKFYMYIHKDRYKSSK